MLLYIKRKAMDVVERNISSLYSATLAPLWGVEAARLLPHLSTYDQKLS